MILGKLCHATLQEAAAALVQEGARIDMVDCFRRPDAIEPIAEAAIEIGAQCLWMQLGGQRGGGLVPMSALPAW